MLNETEIQKAIADGTILKDFDGETGKATELTFDGETIAVKIEAENFSRWADSLDLQFA